MHSTSTHWKGVMVVPQRRPSRARQRGKVGPGAHPAAPGPIPLTANNIARSSNDQSRHQQRPARDARAVRTPKSVMDALYNLRDTTLQNPCATFSKSEISNHSYGYGDTSTFPALRAACRGGRSQSPAVPTVASRRLQGPPLGKELAPDLFHVRCEPLTHALLLTLTERKSARRSST